MSAQSTDLAAAYGVTETYTSTGGSVSNALFMAVSVRRRRRFNHNPS